MTDANVTSVGCFDSVYPPLTPRVEKTNAWCVNWLSTFVNTRPDTPQSNAPPRRPNTAKNAASDFITAGTISQAAIDAYVEAALSADEIRVDWKALAEFDALDPKRVTVPTLLIQAQGDPHAATPAQAALFAGLGTSDRTWITLPNCDHAALLETARPRFLRAIVDFVDRPQY